MSAPSRRGTTAPAASIGAPETEARDGAPSTAPSVASTAPGGSSGRSPSGVDAVSGPADDLRPFVEQFVRDFLADLANNNLGPGTTLEAWGDFLLGYSSGADDMYPDLKDHIGPFHWTPAEAFALGAGADPAAQPDDFTVISWALCHTETTKAANREETFFPAESWARARIFGQAVNRALHLGLVEALAARGYPAVAPGQLPEAGARASAARGRASTWSERHVAHISGLGTFGLAGGLITKRGQAVIFGSVVVRATIPPTPRPYDGPFAYCLFLTRGTCGVCADRCPATSVTRAGRDKEACAGHLWPATADYVRREFGFDGYGCGLCQTGVPCESSIPKPLRRRD
ncbi:MAG: epoxyqueuosine reductase [bacterium]